MTPTTIRSLTVADLDIPLFAPFGIAGGAQDVARNLLVTVELADGTRGYGEAAPLPPYNGETQASARAALEQARASVEGADVREWRPIAALLRDTLGGAGSARCALETAVLDALTKRAGVPLWAFFGGAGTSLETDMTVTTGSVEDASAGALDILARGIKMIKVKVGGGDLDLDLRRVVAISAVAPDSPLLLDGNGGMRADDALKLMGALHAQNIRPALLEQPVPRDDLAGMAQLVRWGDVAVAADESATSAAAVLRLAHEGAAHVVNIKLMKAGVVEALDIAAVCRAAGLRLMIGGNVESILAMTMSAHFAAGLGGFEFADLDTPLFLASNPFRGGFQQTGARLDLAPISAGHGVEPLYSDGHNH